MGIARIGSVGWDNIGLVQFLFSIYLRVHSNNYRKAWMILRDLEKAYEMGWRRVIYETDFMILVSLLNKRNYQEAFWRMTLVIKKIICLPLNFESVSFVHVPKEWNRVANYLAKWTSKGISSWNVTN